MTKKIFLAIAFYLVGHVIAWYQTNSQFVWPWAKNNLFLTVVFLSIPAGLCFALGTRILMEETSKLWFARFLGFGISYAVFPLMTWHYLNESMFTTKTMTCIALAALIMYIQLFWK
jgi:hypothetical protein